MLKKDSETVTLHQHLRLPKNGNIMLFELSVHGHHAVYIQHLVRYWCETAWLADQALGHFYVVVAPQFLEKHRDMVAIAQQHPKANVSFVAISATEELTLLPSPKSFLQRKLRSWQEWALVCAYAERLKISHCFLDSFDFFLGPFVLGKTPPCLVSGIYFKPTFHYATFAAHQPTPKSYVQQWREQLTLAAVFRRPHLYRLFCLDPFAVEVLNRRFAQGQAVALADPVSTYLSDNSDSSLSAQPLEVAQDLRSRLSISSDRKIFLLFGDLSARKGIQQLIDAIALLPASSCQQLCLLIVGRCSAAAKLSFQASINALRQSQPVQIMEHYKFVSDQELQAYFQLADVVLAPYQKHVGMSGILLQAAAAGKPVLSSNYGLMGELVRQHQLGLAVDSTSPVALAKGLTQCLETPLANVCSLPKMAAFAEQNTVEKFARTIFTALMGQP